MRLPVTIILTGLLANAAPVATPQTWVQARMDRVAAAAGVAPGTVHAVLVEGGAIQLGGKGATMAVPRALVMAAPSASALDGMFAMMLAYQKQDKNRRGVSAAEVAALAALVAVTGGVSDQAEGKGSTFIPSNGGQRIGDAESGREKARRGARWMEAAGGCTAALAGYLRALAHGPVDGGMAIPARRLLADMGALAYPSMQTCPVGDDAGLMTVQTQLAAEHL